MCLCVQSAGYTALMLASESGHLDIVTMLVARDDLDVNRASTARGSQRGGDTALMLSCRKGHMDIARLLLGRPDVDVNVVNVSTCRHLERR